MVAIIFILNIFGKNPTQVLEHSKCITSGAQYISLPLISDVIVAHSVKVFLSYKHHFLLIYGTVLGPCANRLLFKSFTHSLQHTLMTPAWINFYYIICISVVLIYISLKSETEGWISVCLNYISFCIYLWTLFVFVGLLIFDLVLGIFFKYYEISPFLHVLQILLSSWFYY